MVVGTEPVDYTPVRATPYKPVDNRVPTGPFEGSTEYTRAFPPKQANYVRAKGPSRKFKEPSPPFDGETMNSKFFPARAFVPRIPCIKPPRKELKSQKGDYSTVNSRCYVPKKATPWLKPKKATFTPTKDTRDWKTDKQANYIQHSPVRTQAFKPKTRELENIPFEATTEAQSSFVPKKANYVRAKRPVSIREAGLPFEGVTSNMASFPIRPFVPRVPCLKPAQKAKEPTKGEYSTEAGASFVPKKATPFPRKARETFTPTADTRDWKTDKQANYVQHSPVRTQAFKPQAQVIESARFEATTEAQRSFVPKKANYVRAKAPVGEALPKLPFTATTEYDERVGPRHDSHTRIVRKPDPLD
jgi:hypothetical protein